MSEARKLSFHIRRYGIDHGRYRTRQKVLLGARLPNTTATVRALGWEGDRFVVGVL